MTNHLTEEEVFAQAALLIETLGWRQEDYGSPSTGFCAVGALGYVAEDDPHAGNDWDETGDDPSLGERCFRRLYRYVGGSPFTWNDDDRREQAEVIAAFRELAAAAVPA